jgi:sodium-dependent dicarboxylate transporter 2/3/5
LSLELPDSFIFITDNWQVLFYGFWIILNCLLKAPNTILKKAGLAAGPILFLFAIFLPIEGLSLEAKYVLGIAVWMATWWISEVFPLYVTSLIPLVLFPILGVVAIDKVFLYYVDKIVLLFFGGFLLAKSVEKSNLHKRFALNVLKIFGTKPKSVIGGFILVTASLSAWMTNTATAILILPIAVAVVSQIKNDEKSRFGTCLMLCIAYSASLGGVATLIGTPPNALLASLSESLAGINVSFAKWMLIGVPVSGISLVILWVYMISFAKLSDKPIIGTKSVIRKEITKLGTLMRDEKIVLIVFVIIAVGWITRGLVWQDHFPLIEDHTIILLGVFVLFFIPSKNNKEYLLDINSAKKIPWGVLVLIGGGLALAGGFTESGLDIWIAEQLSFVEGMAFFVIIMIIVAVTIFSGELMSNTAGAALLLPIMASLASNLDVNPILLMAPVAIATSFGFMMPVGTPPNAIVFGSGYISAKKMAKFGFPLNLISIVVLTVLMFILLPLIWK